MDLLVRMRTFGWLLGHCADEDLRSAYDADIRAAIEPNGEALCFAGLCVAEAKRRGLDTADWPALAVAVPIGPEEEVAAELVSLENEDSNEMVELGRVSRVTEVDGSSEPPR